MKGVILAGGSGTRLHPLTKVISKQLLPVFDKPMIYYPLTTLILAGVTEILIITRQEDSENFQRLLQDGSQWGIKISYDTQAKPEGIAQAPLIAEDFLNGENFCLILGDNLLYGPGLGRKLQKFEILDGAAIFAYRVKNPSEYGVVKIDSRGKPIEIVEKPKNPESNFAIPGLYFFDNKIIEICKSLTPSSRGELEITDVLNVYLAHGKLKVEILPIGTAWLDMGNHKSLLEASEFVHVVQSRQGILIGDPETASSTRSEMKF